MIILELAIFLISCNAIKIQEFQTRFLSRFSSHRLAYKKNSNFFYWIKLSSKKFINRGANQGFGGWFEICFQNVPCFFTSVVIGLTVELSFDALVNCGNISAFSNHSNFSAFSSLFRTWIIFNYEAPTTTIQLTFMSSFHDKLELNFRNANGDPPGIFIF
ncbi:hypothetical protein AVEN_13233-1 [Araneus ventricosus]|uniref:Uncharacterized protein n=1 Tax=Araneus ventricosus TaxID=182803 RepID=A0A4Y2DKS7_ARAVE|nr:hypothetical protein AVEN_13233-1 [Araneus ventricosus]